MKLAKLSRPEFEKAYKRCTSRGHNRKNKYSDIYDGLYALGLGESLMVSFDTKREAVNCQASISQHLRTHGCKNGVTYRSFLEENNVYFYPKARVV